VIAGLFFDVLIVLLWFLFIPDDRALDVLI